MSRRLVAGIVLITLCIAADKERSTKPTLLPEENTILELTNKARAEEKLAPLKLNATLTEVARAHSHNMADKGEMNHVLDGKNPAERIRAAGYKYSSCAENIAMGENVSLPEIFEAWMKSKGHRENIMKPEFREIGIGIARDPKGRVYYTQEFGKSR
jgi:uncharacterized protein YkwD